MYGCHCGSASKVSNSGSTSVRDQGNAVVSLITSAISHPVLLGFIGSTSCISRHMPDFASTLGRQAHRQYSGITRQPGQRSAREPRATNGFTARARRWVRKRETAWLIGCAAGKWKSTQIELGKAKVTAVYQSRPRLTVLPGNTLAVVATGHL